MLFPLLVRDEMYYAIEFLEPQDENIPQYEKAG
jgi:DNA-dependent RNA polymerase auxiliary subunit epsilon